MAVTPNTITTDDVVEALNIEFVSNFEKQFFDFITTLGLGEPEILRAGTALYQYTVTGALNNSATEDSSSGTAYVEGDEVALSKYEVDKNPIGEITMKPYRKRTTAAAIQKAGFANSVLRTDNRMLNDIRADIQTGFFNYLAAGTGIAAGINFQDTLAQTDAVLMDELEERNFGAGRILHFVNRFDIADYLGRANVGLATVFGINYLASFLGIDNIVVSSKVARGTVIATPAENIRVLAGDFAGLAEAALAYQVGDHGLIGVYHEPNYGRVSAETHALTGVTMLPEYTDFIVKGTIGTAPSA